MRISELSERTGVPVPTIKYYLREGLLPHGDRTAATQATYDERHVERLRLIRVLREVGDVPVAGIAAVVAAVEAVESGDRPIGEVLGTAHHALGPEPPLAPDDAHLAARAEMVDYLRGKGWLVATQAPALDVLAGALVALRRLGVEGGAEWFEPYVGLADTLAAAELATIDASAGPSSVVEQVIVGTVVYEQALIALRRLAEEHHSALRFPLGDAAEPAPQPGASRATGTRRSARRQPQG